MFVFNLPTRFDYFRTGGDDGIMLVLGTIGTKDEILGPSILLLFLITSIPIWWILC